MIAQDVVNLLSASLPIHSSAFGDSEPLLSLVVSGATVTAVTAATHGIVDGQNVAINGADAPVQINTGTFSRVGSTASFSTIQDHDLTLSPFDIENGKTVTLSGAAEPEFNGEFVLVSVPSRSSLIIAVADSGPLSISGSPIVDNANGELFNGLFTASNVTANTFDYSISIAYPIDAVATNATAQTQSRIISVLDINQYLNDIYTEQPLSSHVIAVQLGDVVESKNRNELSDAGSSTSGELSYTPLYIQSFAVYIIQNVTNDITGAIARDRVESEYVPAIFKSILRAKFDTQFSLSGYRCTCSGHGAFAYFDAEGKNKAVYTHEITFEMLAQLDAGDMVGPDSNVAMRNVVYGLTTDQGTGELNAEANLDEVS